MGIRLKFNLAMLATFLVGLGITGLLLKQHFETVARSEALQTARVMMAAANAMRHYTSNSIRPLLGSERDGKFLAESVPSFAAQTIFRQVSTEFGAYIYKEAALNPTNLADRAGDWEADIISQFRNDASIKEIVSERNTATGVFIGLAHPIAVSEPCLPCHTHPSVAPASMTQQYGDSNGFGWKLGEVIGAQVASLPIAGPMNTAHRTLYVFLGLLTGVFLLMLGISNVLLHYLVIKPVVTMSRIATEVSLGHPSVEQFKDTGKDEISALSAAFNRMRRSLESAMQMLEES